MTTHVIASSSSHHHVSTSNIAIVANNFKVGKKIGEGSFGIVYEGDFISPTYFLLEKISSCLSPPLGTALHSGQPVAIKFVRFNPSVSGLNTADRGLNRNPGSQTLPNYEMNTGPIVLWLAPVSITSMLPLTTDSRSNPFPSASWHTPSLLFRRRRWTVQCPRHGPLWTQPRGPIRSLWSKVHPEDNLHARQADGRFRQPSFPLASNIPRLNRLALQLNRVQAIHEKFLIYRDIKPDNFLIGPPNSKTANVVHVVVCNVQCFSD